MVYDFPLSIAEDLTAMCTASLKKWYGIARPAEISILYRSRSRHGLGLTSLISHFKAMKVCKAHLAKHSPDPAMRTLHSLTLRAAKHSPRWSAHVELEGAEAEVDLEIRFPSQSTRHGVGFAPRRARKKADPTADHRARVVAKVKQIVEEQSLARVYSLAQGGDWLKLSNVMEHDLSWQSQLHCIPEERLKFLLNSIQLTLPTPSNLRLWGKLTAGRCSLCGHPNATLLHILAGCSKALDRFTWRHNLVLYVLLQHLPGRLRLHNSTPTCTKPSPLSTPIPFVAAGTTPPRRIKKTRFSSLDGATDWRILVDVPETPLVVPPHIMDTPLRPDLLLWSDSLKTVVLGELTCPWEDNLLKAHLRKTVRYDHLVDSIKLAGWSVSLHTFEIGCRGFASFSFRQLLTLFDLPPPQLNAISKRASQVVLQASYLIFKSRHNASWRPFDLVKRSPPP